MTTTTAPAAAQARIPRQIPYIIGNEACERFGFYGMRNILTPFLIGSLLLFAPEAERAGIAKDVFHTFVIGVYFFPLLGGWLSDRFFGKYRTTLWLSLVYCLGFVCLALSTDNRAGFYTGLFLIALGSGGIKPLVSAFVGDQFDQGNKHLAKVVYDAFYWTINFGSFFASLLMPIFLRSYGPAVAFGIPGALMFVATFVFWLGRRKYVMVPPSPPNPHSFLRVARTALLAQSPGRGRPGLIVAGLGGVLALAALAWLVRSDFVIAVLVALGLLIAFGGVGTSMQLERARGAHPDEAVDGVRAVLRILIVFALITPFWSLFDQKASTWVIQGDAMRMPTEQWWWPGWLVKSPAQMQALNPILVMLIIPFNNLVLYPFLQRLGIEVTALRRMGVGLAFSGLSWVVAGLIQLQIDGGDAVSIALADRAVRAAHLRRGAGLGDRAGVRLQPGTARDEGRHHELLAAVSVLRQPVGAGHQRGGAQRGGDGADRRYRFRPERVPDVLLRRLRVPRRARVRAVRAALSDAGPLPRGLSRAAGRSQLTRRSVNG